MPWLSHTKGPSAVTRISMLRTANGASRRQLFAPIVFGMISEKTKIARVISAAMTDSHPTDKPRKSNPLWLPNTLEAWAPTPIAPTVWAIVLSVRIADNGLSISSVNSVSFIPVKEPSSRALLTYDGVTLSKTASQIEHKNEKMMDNKRNRSNKVMRTWTPKFSFSSIKYIRGTWHLNYALPP